MRDKQRTGRPKGAHLAILCNDCGMVKEHQRWLRCDVCTKKHNKMLAAERAAMRYSDDPSKAKVAAKRWLKKSRDRARQYEGKRNGMNIPLPLRPAPAACEICEKPDVRKDGASRGLSLDHCHATGSFRGWLCFKCNVGIGKLGDTSAGLKRALAYLEKAEQAITGSKR